MNTQNNIVCKYDGYTWQTKSTHLYLTCPSCMKKTLNPNALTRNQKEVLLGGLYQENNKISVHFIEDINTLSDEHLIFKINEQIRAKYQRLNGISFMVIE